MGLEQALALVQALWRPPVYLVVRIMPYHWHLGFIYSCFVAKHRDLHTQNIFVLQRIAKSYYVQINNVKVIKNNDFNDLNDNVTGG